MDKSLYSEIVEALKNRQSWESKQEGFFKVRFGGIKRSKKPYPNAPDTHVPLVDSMIDKLKPLFIQQLYANDNLASFVATKQQDPAMSTQASEWFDYKLKQCSNFEEEIFSGIDQAQECGFITLKVYCKGKTLCFSTVDNMHTIVPDYTEDLQDSDWFVHVIPISKSQYRRNPHYTDKTDAFINSICGKGTSQDSGSEVKAQLLQLREGIAYGQTDNQIVVWEVWRKENDSAEAKWMVDTISPVLGWDKPLRPSFKNTFKHGKLPFFRIRTEITKKGWYTSRGVPELLAPQQMCLKKLQDGSLQYVDYSCLPMYKNTGTTPLPNAGNFAPVAGKIMPPGVDTATALSAPPDFQIMAGVFRAQAEDRISVPDLGAPMHYGARPDSKGKTTATQINAEVGQSNQGNDMRARVFRLDLAKGFKLAWLTLIDICKDEVSYLLDQDLKEVDPAALHGNYTITPNGSPDSWNRPAQFQKAMQRYMVFRGDPFTNQSEIRKAVWELDGTGAVKRFFQDPGEQAKKQEEQQASEILLMLQGFSPSVDQADDDKQHIKTIDEFVKRRQQANEPFTPEVARLLLMHGAEHAQSLAQKKDPALKQVEALMMPTIQFLEQVASQPDNIVPMQQPGAAGTGGGSLLSASGSAAAPPEKDPIGDSAKLMNSLSSLIKAGAPVTHAQLNEALAMGGLPPLPLTPIAPVEPARPPGHQQLPPPPEKKEAA